MLRLTTFGISSNICLWSSGRQILQRSASGRGHEREVSLMVPSTYWLYRLVHKLTWFALGTRRMYFQLNKGHTGVSLFCGQWFIFKTLRTLSQHSFYWARDGLSPPAFVCCETCFFFFFYKVEMLVSENLLDCFWWEHMLSKIKSMFYFKTCFLQCSVICRWRSWYGYLTAC